MQHNSKNRRNQHQRFMRRLDRKIQNSRHAKHYAHLKILKSPSLRQNRLNMSHPVDTLVVIDEIAKPNHNQKRTAKRVNHRRRLVQDLAVLDRLMKRQIDNIHKSVAARNHHNSNWQYKSNDKHRHKYASRQEDFLPNLAHSRQNLAIYHRVVEAKRNFQNHQNSK